MAVFNLGNGNDIFNGPVSNGDTVNGENGDDGIFLFGDSLLLTGGNGDDEIDVTGNNNTVLGENGDDELSAQGNDNSLEGNNGDDSLEVVGDDNSLEGNRGDDSLVADGVGNTLSGGRGDDVLESDSSGGFFAVGAGNTMTGGRGEDTFKSSNTSDLVVTNDSGSTADVVDDGDTINGVIDVITDFGAGDTLDLDVTTEAGVVGLDGFGAGHQHLELADGEYGLFAGTLTGDGMFTVDSTGDDVLVVWDSLNSVNEPFLQGAIALLDTDVNDVLIA